MNYNNRLKSTKQQSNKNPNQQYKFKTMKYQALDQSDKKKMKKSLQKHALYNPENNYYTKEKHIRKFFTVNQKYLKGSAIPETWNQGQFKKIKNQQQSSQNKDPRKLITSFKFPYTAIGVLCVQIGESRLTGTAFLIGDNIALTCAHNVYIRDIKSYIDVAYFTPGMSGGKKNGVTCQVMSIFVPKQYRQSDSQKQIRNNDFALIILNVDERLGKYYGFFQLKKQTNPKLSKNDEVQIYGYPQDLNLKENKLKIAYHLFGHKSTIQCCNQKKICYNVFTSAGQSGSPVFKRNKYLQFELVGVHTGTNIIYNFGTYLSSQIKNKVYNWIINLSQKNQEEQIRFNVAQSFISFQQTKNLFKSMLNNKNQKSNQKNLQKTIEQQIKSINDPKELFEKGKAQYYKSNYVKAMKYFQKALKLYQNQKKQQTQECAYVLNRMGIIYRRERKYQEALKCYQRVLKIDQKNQKRQSIDYADVLQNIGNVYYDLNKKQQAMKKYNESLEIFQKIKGKQSIQCIQTINNIAGIYYSNGNYDEAIKGYERALNICRKHYGQNHIQLCVLLSNLAANYYFNKNNKPLGKEYISKSLNLLKINNIKQHEYYAHALYHSGRIHFDEQQNSKARTKFQQAKSMLEDMYGKNNNNQLYHWVCQEIKKIDKLEL